MATRITSTLVLTASLGIGFGATAQLSNYSQDFEGLDRSSPTALSDDGWELFASSTGGTLPDFADFAVGPFPAPNDINSPFNSVISDANSGGNPPAGNQGFTLLSDFGSPLTQVNADTRTLNISVFQTQVIGAGDIGSVWSFDFLAQGNAVAPTGGQTVEAFLVTLDPNAGFSATNTLTLDLTGLNPLEQLNGSLEIDLSDPLLEGQLLQFGFRNTAADGTFAFIDADNLNFSVVPEPASLALLGLGGLAALARRRQA